MRTFVVRKIPGGMEHHLWTGDMDSAPRKDEFLCINPDDASYIVESVEWDCSSKHAELKVFVT